MPEEFINKSLLATRKDEYDAATERASAAARELEEARRARDKARDALITAMEIEQRNGLTWKAIGQELGITAQAASQMYKRATGRG